MRRTPYANRFDKSLLQVSNRTKPQDDGQFKIDLNRIP
jgi:hypothetical protein